MLQKHSHFITCPACHQSFQLPHIEQARFCPLCGHSLSAQPAEQPSLEAPLKHEILSNRYQLLESIGKGGMGEVFLAFDTFCGRKIALKRIRADLLEHPQIRHRFLKEAHITCQLTHPAIIPIYSIQAVQLSAYYTMPFVEGETLKQIIRKTRLQEKKGEKLDHLGGSIPALMRIFITICQAVAYAHSKGVLHRDLKPENIIIGKYGEVLILDWGLAKYIHSSPSDEDDENKFPVIPLPQNSEITRIGKVVGTVAYMAPERALSQPATIQTDIYALGVILYQLLTLNNPFKRGTLEEFRQNISKEQWNDPILVAPYRDISRVLARITEKCLSFEAKARYDSVGEIIRELENYLEGRSDWFHIAELDINRPADWEFQEHVLIAEHMAITRVTEESEWVNLMIAHSSFTGNIRIETSLYLKESCHGIGILLSIPEISERTYINDGYCLWLGSETNRSTKLLRSNVEVMHAPDIFLKHQQWIPLRIEKIDQTIHLYLNDVLQFSYIALLPLIGTHIGLLSRDVNFEISPLKISVGSLNLTVNCLAVPDAFLAHRDFSQALSEYRRIAYSFPDRAEGREAIFRAGLTFIEQSKESADKIELLDQALEEFQKLHDTPGGPLEYLGKALVYEVLNENEEEIKCFELAYRRYPKHPLLPILQEQILSRMHEVSRQQRIMTYRFILLTTRYFSPSIIDKHTRRLFLSLQKHWEILPFIEEHSFKIQPSSMLYFAIPLAFWLAQPYILGEIIDHLLREEHVNLAEVNNALVSLIKLGAWEYAEQRLKEVKKYLKPIASIHESDIEDILKCHQQTVEQAFKDVFSSPLASILSFSRIRTLLYLLDQALDQNQTLLVHQAIASVENCSLTSEIKVQFVSRQIWAYLLEKNWQRAGQLLYSYSVETLNQESTLLHFLYGCWLQATEGREMAAIHFSGLLQISYPRSWTLASHEMAGNLSQHNWLSKAFFWEKRELYRQLSLYYHCAHEEKQSQLFKQLYEQQFIYVPLE